MKVRSSAYFSQGELLMESGDGRGEGTLWSGRGEGGFEDEANDGWRQVMQQSQQLATNRHQRPHPLINCLRSLQELVPAECRVK